jgi:L-rhamnose mutarotase
MSEQADMLYLLIFKKSMGQNTRAAFKMKLKKGFEEEYKTRHDNIWPELSKLLTEAGIADYSIFLDRKTLILFAVQKLSPDNTAPDLPLSPIMRKWWNYMSDIMETNPDGSPVVTKLDEVFHID